MKKGEVNSTSKKITLIPHLATLHEVTRILQMHWQWSVTHRAPKDFRDTQVTSGAGWKEHTEHRDWGAGECGGEAVVGLVWV